MIIPCPSCKERIRFNEQERHNERECPERTLNCKYCKEPFHFKNIKVRHHLFRLMWRWEACPGWCSTSLCESLCFSQAHDEICPKYPMICEGCAKKKIPREKVNVWKRHADEMETFCSKRKAFIRQFVPLVWCYYVQVKQLSMFFLQNTNLENT